MMINNFYRVGRMKTVLRHETMPSSDRYNSQEKIEYVNRISLLKDSGIHVLIREIIRPS